MSGVKRISTSVRRDPYTIAMIALVPALLLTAWALSARESFQLPREQCRIAKSWLVESEMIAPKFTNARIVGNTTAWLVEFEEINSPVPAGQLRGGIIGAVTYQQKYFPRTPANEAAAANTPDGLFARDIQVGAENLLEHCPDLAPLLPSAFPMIFPKGVPH